MFFNFSYPTVCYDIEQNLKKGLKIWKLYHLANLFFITIGIIVILFSKNFILSYFHITTKDVSTFIEILKIALIVPILLVISQALRQLMFAINLSRSRKFGEGSQVETTNIIWSRFASGGRISSFFLGIISEITSSDTTTSSPTHGEIFCFLNIPLALHSITPKGDFTE